MTSIRFPKKIVYAFLVYAWIEFMCFLLLGAIAKKYPSAVFRPPNQINKDLQKNLLDPIGWGSESIQTSSKNSLLDKKGCRIHLFGDSFMEANTYDYIRGIDNTKTTPEDLLSELTDCAVYNHGQGGYGSDQAYLKFLKRVGDSSIRKGDFVVLSHLTENIIRNANRNRSLLVHNGISPILKPKFKIEKKELTLIPIPNILDAEILDQLKTKKYPDLLRNGENPLFIPGATFGSPALISYPYSLNLVRAISSWHILPRLLNKTRYDRFYLQDSQSYRVTLKLIHHFHKKCTEIGCHSLSIDLPISEDFDKLFVNGKNSFPLTKDLKDHGIDHVSIGELQLDDLNAERSLLSS